MTKSIYFICSGNSCRSQMAEGYAKKFLPAWDVRSAGVNATSLNPKAVKVMAEDDIDISQQYSKVIDQDFMNKVDVVVTLCGDARDKCVIPQSSRWIHWPLTDPAQATGSDAEVMDVFRNIRDEIKKM